MRRSRMTYLRMASLKISPALLALLLSMVFVLAGPISERDIAFTFVFPDGFQPEHRDWRMSIVSVAEFEADGWNFESFYIPQAYRGFKQQCGSDNAFHETVYEMSAEERQHKGCVINGTYQEVYCFKPVSDIPACQELAPWKIDEQYRLTFDSYYNSLMWDIGRAQQYAHYGAAACDLAWEGTDGPASCTLSWEYARKPYNPFIIVLERRNSTEAYISAPLDIPQMQAFDNPAFECGTNDCDVHLSAVVPVSDLRLERNGELGIAFDTRDAEPDSDIQPQRGWLARFLAWFVAVF